MSAEVELRMLEGSEFQTVRLQCQNRGRQRLYRRVEPTADWCWQYAANVRECDN